jgi:hypothetical protein
MAYNPPVAATKRPAKIYRARSLILAACVSSKALRISFGFPDRRGPSVRRQKSSRNGQSGQRLATVDHRFRKWYKFARL